MMSLHLSWGWALQLMCLHSGKWKVTVAIFQCTLTWPPWMPLIRLSMTDYQNVCTMILIPFNCWGAIVPSDGQNSRQQYWIRYDSYSTWTVILTSLHLWTFSNHHNLVYISIFWCTYLFSSLAYWKNNHLWTTPAWLHPAHVVLYICNVPGIFQCLNPF